MPALGSTVTVSAQFFNESDELESPATPLVDIIDSEGTTRVTDAAVTMISEGIGEYEYLIPEDGPLGTWIAHFTGDGDDAGNDYFEVTADPEPEHYFTVAEARAFRGGKLANETKYPDADIVEARAEIEELFEEVCDRAFVVRTKTVYLDGSGKYELMLPDLRVNEITAITVTDSSGSDTVYDAADLSDIRITEYGFLRRRTRGYFTHGWGNVAVTYTYGEETPLPIKRAALVLLYNRLVPSDVSDRAQSFTNESGTLAYSSPNGMQKPTGIPEVDSVLWKFSEHRVSIA